METATGYSETITSITRSFKVVGEYIESLDRPLNSVELYYMPIRLIPNAMWHDFKVVWKGLLGDELFHRLGAVIKRLESQIG